MTVAKIALLALVFGLLGYDVAVLRGKSRRLLYVEALAFVAGAFFIVWPERATSLAHFVGIGRGVDFFLYPIVIWLVRESMLTRRRRIEDDERLTRVVRALALVEAKTLSANSEDDPRSTPPSP
jgi:hypothetical protein